MNAPRRFHLIRTDEAERLHGGTDYANDLGYDDPLIAIRERAKWQRRREVGTAVWAVVLCVLTLSYFAAHLAGLIR